MRVRALVTTAGIDAGRTAEVDETEQPYAGAIASGWLVPVESHEEAPEEAPSAPLAPEAPSEPSDVPAAVVASQDPHESSE